MCEGKCGCSDQTDNCQYKYNEDKTIDELLEYIKTTYKSHYTNGGKSPIQVLDVWEDQEIAEPMCKGTALKHLLRFGRKVGKNKKDLLKALHYTVLLFHFTEFDSDTIKEN